MAATSERSIHQIAKPTVVVLLSGLSLFYLFQGGAQTTIPNSLPESQITDKAPFADRSQESQSETVTGRLGGLASRGSLRSSAYGALIVEPGLALDQLHKRIADVRAEQDDGARIIVELENQHKAEPVDATWSAQSEVDILSASIEPVMVQAGFQPQDVGTDCRSQTCRVSARFADSSGAQDWANTLVTQLGSTLSQVKMSIIPQPDGSFEVRIYGARNQPRRGLRKRTLIVAGSGRN